MTLFVLNFNLTISSENLDNILHQKFPNQLWQEEMWDAVKLVPPMGVAMRWKAFFETAFANGHDVAIASRSLHGNYFIPLYLENVIDLDSFIVKKIRVVSETTQDRTKHLDSIIDLYGRMQKNYNQENIIFVTHQHPSIANVRKKFGCRMVFVTSDLNYLSEIDKLANRRQQSPIEAPYGNQLNTVVDDPLAAELTGENLNAMQKPPNEDSSAASSAACIEPVAVLNTKASQAKDQLPLLMSPLSSPGSPAFIVLNLPLKAALTLIECINTKEFYTNLLYWSEDRSYQIVKSIEAAKILGQKARQKGECSILLPENFIPFLQKMKVTPLFTIDDILWCANPKEASVLRNAYHRDCQAVKKMVRDLKDSLQTREKDPLSPSKKNKVIAAIDTCCGNFEFSANELPIVLALLRDICKISRSTGFFASWTNPKSKTFLEGELKELGLAYAPGVSFDASEIQKLFQAKDDLCGIVYSLIQSRKQLPLDEPSAAAGALRT